MRLQNVNVYVWTGPKFSRKFFSNSQKEEKHCNSENIEDFRKKSNGRIIAK